MLVNRTTSKSEPLHFKPTGNNHITHSNEKVETFIFFHLEEGVQQLSATALCCDVLFNFTVLYFLLLNISERSADRLSLAPSAIAYKHIVLYRIRTLVFNILPSRI